MSTYGEQNQAWTCKKFPTRKQNDCIAPDASNRLRAIEWIGGRFFVTAIYVFLVPGIPEGIHSLGSGPAANLSASTSESDWHHPWATLQLLHYLQ